MSPHPTISQLLDKLESGSTIDSRLLSLALSLENWIVTGYIAQHITGSEDGAFIYQCHHLNSQQVRSLIYLLPLTPEVARAKLDLTMRLVQGS